jgi:hypothetical protein
MQSRAPFYALVFLGMIVFGTLEQLVFCSHADPKQKTTPRKQHGNQSESKKGWRNR